MSPEKKNRLLLISYLFPPAGGVAVQRALSLAKYLPQCGYYVHVLSAKNAAGPVRDPGLLAHVPACVTLNHAFTPELPFHVRQTLWKWLSGRKAKPANGDAAATGGKTLLTEITRRVLCPEPEVVWVPFATRKASAIVRQYHIDTVLVTAPPFSAFLVGLALKRKFPKIRLVSDFRDDWLGFYLRAFDFQRSDYTRRRAQAIERATVGASTLVSTVTESIQRQLQSRYTDQPAKKIVLIPNGYDPESFAGFAHRPHQERRIVVTHVGTVYSASSPRYYLDALDQMPEEVRSCFETRLIGRITPEEQPLLTGRKSDVKILGFLPQPQALRCMEETDYLLLTLTDAGSSSGKIFEYLASNTPILALAPPDGEVARILHETATGMCVDPQQSAAIRKELQRMYDQRDSARSGFQPNWPAIRRYERPRLAAEFGRLMQG